MQESMHDFYSSLLLLRLLSFFLFFFLWLFWSRYSLRLFLAHTLRFAHVHTAHMPRVIPSPGVREYAYSISVWFTAIVSWEWNGREKNACNQTTTTITRTREEQNVCGWRSEGIRADQNASKCERVQSTYLWVRRKKTKKDKWRSAKNEKNTCMDIEEFCVHYTQISRVVPR